MQWYSEGGTRNYGKLEWVPQWGKFKGMSDYLKKSNEGVLPAMRAAIQPSQSIPG